MTENHENGFSNKDFLIRLERQAGSALVLGLKYAGEGLTERMVMKILVIDDHPLIREALRSVFKELKADLTVLEAPNCRLAMALIAEHQDIQLILLDLNLPDRDGFSVLAELREHHPAMAVVVLSAQQDRPSVLKALHLGALGFIPNPDSAK